MGRIRSFHNHYGRILKPVRTTDGYSQVTLTDKGKQIITRLHILVAQTFIPNPENKPQVNHLDGNRANCRVDNLEWVTPKENIQHAYRTGLAKSGSDHPRSLLTAEQVRYIRRVYKKGDPEFGMSALGKKIRRTYRRY
ncbi:MAG: HNH endonuclease [Selenomonadaceae bacterium]|nr:HNH endonuclease [Selenomonadaceae bacterium]